eukprot:TRINITY_DN10102_c0_g1_i3.p1 TRINITY_DN10102_c0_g1~~TRINITY_DN10102_c0_g1_i3.p1  ORF type:complete len:163 (+),score=13.81 TRINITY_DN10102_c0_g1_i3:50-538(+)
MINLSTEFKQECSSLLGGVSSQGIMTTLLKSYNILTNSFQTIHDSSYNLASIRKELNTKDFYENDRILNYINNVLLDVNGQLFISTIQLIESERDQNIYSFVGITTFTFLMLFFVWIPFRKKLQVDIIESTRLLSIVPMEIILNNSYVKSFLKRLNKGGASA